MALFNRVDSGGVMLSYQCTNSCRHCLYACSPEYGKWMSGPDLELLFSQLSSHGKRLRGFHIAGGEPMLRPELSEKAVREAVRNSVPLEYMETNGFWARSGDSEKSLRNLKNAGLQALLISLSPFHSEFIPLAVTMNAIRMGESVFGKNGIFVWRPEFFMDIAKAGEDRTVAVEQVDNPDELIRRCVKAYSIVLGGRAALRLTPSLERKPARTFFRKNCFRELFRTGHAHFDPFYNYIPGFCAGISLGDWRDLDGIFTGLEIETLPFVKRMAHDIEDAYTFACDNGFEPRDGYASKCHLCLDMRRQLSGLGLPEIGPSSFYETLNTDS